MGPMGRLLPFQRRVFCLDYAMSPLFRLVLGLGHVRPGKEPTNPHRGHKPATKASPKSLNTLTRSNPKRSSLKALAESKLANSLYHKSYTAVLSLRSCSWQGWLFAWRRIRATSPRKLYLHTYVPKHMYIYMCALYTY